MTFDEASISRFGAPVSPSAFTDFPTIDSAHVDFFSDRAEFAIGAAAHGGQNVYVICPNVDA